MIKKYFLLVFLILVCINISPEDYNYAIVKWGKLELGYYKNDLFQKYLNSYKEINNNIVVGYGFNGKINRIIKHNNNKVEMIEYYNKDGKLIAKSIYDWKNNGYIKKYYDCYDEDYTLKVDLLRNTFIYELSSRNPSRYKRTIEGDLDLMSVLYTIYNKKGYKIFNYQVTKYNNTNGVIESHYIKIYTSPITNKKAYEIIKTSEGIVEKDYLNKYLKDNDYIHRKNGKEYDYGFEGEIVVRNYIIDDKAEFYITKHEKSKFYALVFDNMVYSYHIDYEVDGYYEYTAISCSISLSLYPTKVSKYLDFTKSKSLIYRVYYYMLEKDEFGHANSYKNDFMKEDGELMKYIKK